MMHILVVDNQPDICALVRAALEETDAFQVSCAFTGSDAIARLDTDRPDLIILDLVMPGVHGLDVAASAHARGILLLMMTGEPHVAVALQRLACPHLKKPFRLEQLLAEIHAAVDDPDENKRSIGNALELLPGWQALCGDEDR